MRHSFMWNVFAMRGSPWRSLCGSSRVQIDGFSSDPGRVAQPIDSFPGSITQARTTFESNVYVWMEHKFQFEQKIEFFPRLAME